MSLLAKLKIDLGNQNKYDAVPPAAVGNGDVLVVQGINVRVVPYGTPTDGDVLTVDAASATGWTIAAQTGGGGGGASPSGTVVTETSFGQSSTAGISANYSRGDHTHGTPTAPTAASVGAAPDTLGFFLIASDAAAPFAREFVVDGTSISSTDLGPGSTYTIQVNPSYVFIASGASHRVGLVPDPPASAGTDKVLREDATWATSASVVRAALIGPPKLVFTQQCIEYMLVSALSPGTTAMAGGTARHDLHYEEHPDGATYDAIHAFSSAGVGNNAVFGIYSMHATTNAPDALLWVSTGSSTNVGSTTHTKTFASDGTWQAAGAAYKDGSNRLRLLQGQGVWKASLTDGTVTWRAMNSGQCRNIGIAADGTTFYQGYSEGGLTYPNLPATATPATLTTQIPILPLRWV